MIRLRAPAKINLSLEVTGRRPDGYHLLQGITVFADIGDVITIERAETDALIVQGPYGEKLSRDCAPGDNLITKSITRYGEATGQKGKFRSVLDKIMPPAAGIGGGSADAAAALLALNELEDQRLSDEELQKIGLGLGADVPVCLSSSATWVSGIGDELRPLQNFPSFGIVLVNPGKSLATPEVFKGTNERSARCNAPKGLNTQSAVLTFLKAHKNDLTPAAIEIVPEIGPVLSRLSEAGPSLYAAMSGSGATCFALYKDAADAGLAAQNLQTRLPGHWVAAGQTRDWTLQSRQTD